MSYFAHLDKNNIVTTVIVAEQDFINSGKVGDPSEWVETSYNTYGGVHYGPDGSPDGGVALRKNAAAIGFFYDESIDGFIPPKPYASWVLNEGSGLWDSPVSVPDDVSPGNVLIWDEDVQSWIEIQKEV